MLVHIDDDDDGQVLTRVKGDCGKVFKQQTLRMNIEHSFVMEIKLLSFAARMKERCPGEREKGADYIEIFLLLFFFRIIYPNARNLKSLQDLMKINDLLRIIWAK